MEGTASTSRPRTAHSRYAAAPDAQQDGRKGPPGQTRANQASPEVISNLITSLSSISDQSDQLFDRLVPVQDKGIRPRSSSKSFKRTQASHVPNKEIAPPLPPLSLEENAQSKGRSESKAESSRPDTRLDTSVGRLPAVQEVASPNTPKSPPSVVASNRPKLGAHPPPVQVPGRSMSITSEITRTPRNNNESEETREAFASISVTPGKTNNESVTSGDSSSHKYSGLGRSSSRAKSNRTRIKELDAERKKRKNNRSAKSPGPKTSTSSQRSPGIPPSPGVPTEGNPSSPTNKSFLAVPPSPRSTSRNNLGYVPEQGIFDPDSMPYAGPSDLSKIKKGGSRGAGSVGPGMIIPPRASSRQSFESTDTRRRANSRGTSPARSRTNSRAKKRSEINKTAFDRNEDDTNKRIRELQVAKEERKKKEEMLLKLHEAPRPVLNDIIPNGGVTNLDSASPEPKNGKRSMAENRSQRAKSALSNHGSETRDSSQIPRGYSQPAFAPPKIREQDAISMADSIDADVDDYMSDARLSQTIYHPQTKRCISYSDVGDPQGSVIICCIGMGCTRFVGALYDEYCQSVGLRLITPERPGIGDSEPYAPTEVDTPLGWPDDVSLICRHLNIQRFSILAHSAGAVYAMATALRVPQQIRGRIHILAPWIPPSQLHAIGLNEHPVPVAELPLIQRILRSIPEPLLEAATRIFNMSSITSSLGKSPYAKRRRRNTTAGGERKRGETPALIMGADGEDNGANLNVNGNENENDPRSTASSPTPQTDGLGSPVEAKRESNSQPAPNSSSALDVGAAKFDEAVAELTEEERAREFSARCTAAIWNLATNANPAIDLMVCLERKQEIGFRYEDITKQVVLHHGTKDTRVSWENVVWIGEKMRRCEVRVLDGEGHGLMASPKVMGEVLSEIAKEWDDWNAVTRAKRNRTGGA